MVKGWGGLQEVPGSSSNGDKNLPIKKKKKIFENTMLFVFKNNKLFFVF